MCVFALGGDPESPAFSELSARVTVLEDELFETANSRVNGSSQIWTAAGKVSPIMRSPMR
jgi:hypothetical protein